MRLLVGLITVALHTTPVFAQDDGGFQPLFSDDFFGGDADAGGARGDGRGQQQQPQVDRLVGLRNLLATANTPLAADQEKQVNALLDKESPAMQARLLQAIQSSGAAAEIYRGAGDAQGRGGQGGVRGNPDGGPQGGQGRSGQGGFRGQGRGRGGQRGGAGATSALTTYITSNPESPVAVEVRRMNDELLAKVTAALNADQQAVIKKYQRDVIKARGIFDIDALKLVMDDAGAPALTAEQIPQIQALYSEHKQAKASLAKQTEGQPDQAAQLSTLDLQTATKLSKMLNGDQRKALLAQMQRDAAAKPK